MDVREKLVDDVHSKLMGLLQRAPYIRCEDVHRQYAVNWLMNNGVTVQEWISVKDRLPEKEGNYLIYVTVPFNGRKFMTVMHYKKYDGASIWNETTHWMTLPQPPKGE